MRPRTRILVPLAFLLLILPSAWPARGHAADVEPALQKQIDAAIERGAAWLRARQRKNGSYPGFGDGLPPNTYNPLDVGLNALVIQTLAHCGVGADDDAIDKCLAFCRYHYAGGKGSWNLKGNDKVMVYVAATLVLALDAIHAKGRPEVQIKRDRYGHAIPPKTKPCKIPTRDRKWIRELVDFLVRTQVKPSGGWRYPDNTVDSVEAETDLSNTQYALLALDVAARCGIEAPVDTWKLAGEHLLREQEDEGIDVPIWVENEAWEEGLEGVERFRQVGTTQARGWCYLPGKPTLSTGSMTCAGVTCLAIVKERLWAGKALEPALSRRLDGGMLDGLAWLSDHFTVQDNPDPGENPWHFYYLYGLERTGAKTGVGSVGRHDWYREGARYLVDTQTPEGGWQAASVAGRQADETESEITQTCFALLFLKRATREPLVPMTPPTLTGGEGAPVDNR
jgi:hypothetical protein